MTEKEIIYNASMHSTGLFLNTFLGMKPAKHQMTLSGMLDSHYRETGIFIARDHGKSTIASYAYPVRLLCKDPNLRILIVQKTGTGAIKSLDIIKKQFETNRIIKKWYADYWFNKTGYRDIANKAGLSDKMGLWQQKRIYLKRKLVSKDPSLEVVGVGGAITGGRADIIILDDILDDENTKTTNRLRDIREWFEGTINQLREPWTKKVVVGTSKTTSELDIYNIIRASPSYKIFHMPAILEPPFEEIDFEPVRDSDGIVTGVDVKNKEEIKVLWEEKWPIEQLLFEYIASVDPAIWKREKLLDATAMAGTVFSNSDFNFYDSEKQKEILKNPNTMLFAALDSAWETTAKADYSSLIVGALLNQKLYLVDLVRDKLDLYQMMDLIVEKYQTWEFSKLSIEKAASGPALIQMLSRETQVPVSDISHGGKSKIERSRTVSPYVRQGRIFVPENADWRETFFNEITQFPFLDHDDTVDAFVYLLMETLLNHNTGGGIHV